jgi:predicted metal-binding membrane protein
VSTILLELFKRDRAIVSLSLVGIVALAWTYLVYMDWGMRHMDIGMSMAIMPAMQHWSAWDLVLVFLMWTVMMIAMMVPTASPVILLFAEINRRRTQQQRSLVVTGQFLLGYLTVWTGFSALATLAQWGLLTAALVSPMMESTSKPLGAGLLLVAGLFQFSRLKYACLAHCRSPIGFFATEWRPGARGAFLMGLKHGSYCLGCCWALMGLLFVLGVMNLFWVAGLSVFVLLEKVMVERGIPTSPRLGRGCRLDCEPAKAGGAIALATAARRAGPSAISRSSRWAGLKRNGSGTSRSLEVSANQLVSWLSGLLFIGWAGWIVLG